MLRHLPVNVRPVISDEKWETLSRLSGLPNEARRYVDELIVILQENTPDELAMEPPAATRKHLKELKGVKR